MSEKFLLSPRHLIVNLWQEGSCTIALTHVNALFAQLKFVDGMDALHRGKHGNLYVESGSSVILTAGNLGSSKAAAFAIWQTVL